MRFAVLGPVCVTVGSTVVPIPGGLRRALLAYLLLHRDQAVDVPTLAEALWGGAPPATSRAQIQAAISALRRALKPYDAHDVLVSQSGGYRILVHPDDLDACRFRSLRREADAAERAGQLATAADQVRAALALWRGPALLGARGAFVDGARAGWEDQRLGALEDVIDLDLRLGRSAGALGEVADLVQRHPLRERLCGQLMLALHRTGRSADALNAYRNLHRRLRAELGVDPGRGLDDLAKAILRDDPELAGPRSTPQHTGDAGAEPASPAPARPAPARPAPAGGPSQLPDDGGYFTGREDELAVIDAARAGARAVVITGAAGTGKTALAVRWAHRRRDAYPDGQLYLDLGGHIRETARSTTDALSYLLRSLGTPPHEAPLGPDEHRAVYRSATADRRLIIVLDNAADAAQVEPLLPASAGCAVIVTSRHRLDALAVRHAVQPITLDVLPRAHAVSLLRTVVGARRLEPERASADRLAALCDDLPLALRIVSARLLVRPELTVGELADQLADAGQRLAGLVLPGEAGVRAALHTSYQTLPVAAARTFRLLSVHPGADFTAGPAAALTDRPYREAVADLDELAAVHLLLDRGGGRFAMHDLIRLYAGELAGTTDSAAARADAWARLTDWYLHTSDAANRLISPYRTVGPPTLTHRLPDTPVPATEAAAFDWFGAERDNIVAVIAAHGEAGADRQVQQLGYFFSGYVERRMSHAHELETLTAVARAAGRLGDDLAEGSAAGTIAVAFTILRRYEEALRHFTAARDLFERAGDARRAAGMLGNVAIVQRLTGRFQQSVDTLQQIRALQEQAGDRRYVAMCLVELGSTCLEMGAYPAAADHYEQALALHAALANPDGQAKALVGIAQARLALGDVAGVGAVLADAEVTARAAGNRHTEARALALAADLAGGGQAPPGGRWVESVEPSESAGAVLDRLRRAREAFDELADRHEVAAATTTIGSVLTRRGELAEARDALRDAAAARERIPDALEEGRLEHAWGDLATRCGDQSAATEHWARADARYAAAHSHRARKLRATLPIGRRHGV